MTSSHLHYKLCWRSVAFGWVSETIILFALLLTHSHFSQLHNFKDGTEYIIIDTNAVHTVVRTRSVQTYNRGENENIHEDKDTSENDITITITGGQHQQWRILQATKALMSKLELDQQTWEEKQLNLNLSPITNRGETSYVMRDLVTGYSLRDPSSFHPPWDAPPRKADLKLSSDKRRASKMGCAPNDFQECTIYSNWGEFVELAKLMNLSVGKPQDSPACLEMMTSTCDSLTKTELQRNSSSFGVLGVFGYATNKETCLENLICVDCSNQILSGFPCPGENSTMSTLLERTILVMENISFTGAIDLEGVFGEGDSPTFPVVAGVSFSDSTFEVDLPVTQNFVVGGDIRMRNVTIKRIAPQINLAVGGNIDLTGSTIIGPGLEEYSMSKTMIMGSFIMENVNISGQGIQKRAFQEANIHGDMIFTGSHIGDAGIQQYAFLDTTIWGVLDFSNATITDNGIQANAFNSATVIGDILLNGCLVSGLGLQQASFALANSLGNFTMRNARITGSGIQPYALAYFNIVGDVDFSESDIGGEGLAPYALHGMTANSFLCRNCNFSGEGLQTSFGTGSLFQGVLDFSHSTFPNNTLTPGLFNHVMGGGINLSHCGIQDLSIFSKGNYRDLNDSVMVMNNVTIPYEGGPFFGLAVWGKNPFVDLSYNVIETIHKDSLEGVGVAMVLLNNNNISVYEAFWFLNSLGAYVETANNPSQCTIDKNSTAQKYTWNPTLTVQCNCTPGTLGTGSFCNKVPCMETWLELNATTKYGTYVPATSCTPNQNEGVPSGCYVTLECIAGYKLSGSTRSSQCLGGAFADFNATCVKMNFNKGVHFSKGALAVTLVSIMILLGVVGFILMRYFRTAKYARMHEEQATFLKEVGTLQEMLIKEREQEIQEYKESWRIDIGQIRVGKEIGRGSFGEVFLAEWLGNRVALKRLHKERLTPDIMSSFENEADAMSQLRHPNIVAFYGAGVDKAGRHFIVAEYMARGSLRLVLGDNAQYKVLTWDQRLQFCVDIAAGMAFLHSRRPPMLHRDLKSDNVLLDGSLVCKVADFGSIKSIYQAASHERRSVGRALTKHQSTMMLTVGVGTPLWTAPEVSQGLHGMARYGASSDVYSFGMVMYEIATRELPFYESLANSSFFELRDAIEQGIRPNITPEVKNVLPEGYEALMTSCWGGVPRERPSFSDIVEQLNTTIAPLSTTTAM
eukprot:m.16986 g.16986  ORF g.16986 m.16986 type:complete len:1197 (+) comp5863_c0_seq1:197-3787(+)